MRCAKTTYIMEQLLIIKTTNAEKIKNVLTKNHIEHQIIYNEPLTAKKPAKKDKLRAYIEARCKEDIFADYGEAIKDKAREREIGTWEEADEEDEEELSKKYGQ